MPTEPTSESDQPEGSVTVKGFPLLATPLAFTTTFPVVAPTGTVVMILVGVHDPVEAVVPLNFTVPVDPKFVPVIVTEAPSAPDVRERLVMFGAGTTVKMMPLLPMLETVTITFPVVAPEGTVVTMLVVVHVVTVAAVPLNFTVLVPCGDPKFVPVIVTDAPTAPEVADKLVIVGAACVPTAKSERKKMRNRLTVVLA